MCNAQDPNNYYMKFLLIAVLTTILKLTTFATAQYPDKIVFKGKQFSLLTNPLEIYFSKHPDKRPKGGIESTALWRGYVATFEIKDNELVLKDIEIQGMDIANKKGNNTKWTSVLNDVFPNQRVTKIDWLTGLLVLPYGKIINYVHMGYGSTYENYVLLEIGNGDFKRAKEFNYLDYQKFKERQFNVFKESEEYKKIKTDLKKDGSSDDFIESFLKDFVIDYTSKILTD